MSRNDHQVEMSGYTRNETKVCLTVAVKWLRVATPRKSSKTPPGLETPNQHPYLRTNETEETNFFQRHHRFQLVENSDCHQRKGQVTGWLGEEEKQSGGGTLDAGNRPVGIGLAAVN